MYDFLWDSKPDKISRQTIKQDLSNGGLKIIDLNLFTNALKCSRIKRIMDDQNNGLWKQQYVKLLNKYGGKLLLECELNENVISDMFKKNIFLKEIMTAWTQINSDKKDTSISNRILWNNENILIQNKTVFRKLWYD